MSRIMQMLSCCLQNFVKIFQNHEIFDEIFENFEIRAAQNCENLVDLEKC